MVPLPLLSVADLAGPHACQRWGGAPIARQHCRKLARVFSVASQCQQGHSSSAAVMAAILCAQLSSLRISAQRVSAF